MSTVAHAGKAKICVEVRGCIDCGTEHADGWVIAKRIGIVISDRVAQIDVHRCNTCATPVPRQLELQPIGGS